MSFEETWAQASEIEGWLTEAQGRRLWDAARRVPPGGQVVEIGSFRGRSAVVLARALAPGASLVCIDPHAGSDRGPQEFAADRRLGDDDHAAFRSNLEAAGVGGRVRHVRAFSSDALGEVDGPIELLWVDGAHRYRPALDDLVRWGARVPPGGRMLVHDSFSSIGVTAALGRAVVFSGRWAWRGRAGSLAEWQCGTAEASDALAALAQLPWFAGNVARKALILLGMRRGPWPY